MPQYAYAVIIVDGKRKVIKTKGYPGAKVILAKNELEKDLKAAGIKYTFIGISEHPPTVAELEKVGRAASKSPRASNSDYTRGKWYFYDSYCLNFTPEYRFAKVIKKIGVPYPYKDIKGIKCQKVVIDLYGYKRTGSSCVPYVSDTFYYMPTEKIKSRECELLYYDDGTTRLRLGDFKYLEQWDGKKPGEVVCHYSPYS